MEEGLRLWVGGVEFDYDELREMDGYADQGFLASADYLRSFLECLRIFMLWIRIYCGVRINLLCSAPHIF